MKEVDPKEEIILSLSLSYKGYKKESKKQRKEKKGGWGAWSVRSENVSECNRIPLASA